MKIISTTICVLICNIVFAQQMAISYTSHSNDIANPERGFYRYTDSESSNHSALDVNELIQLRENENKTLIFRYYYLESFLNGPISNSHLADIAADFGIMRLAGVKVILRFAYSSDYRPNPPHNDSPTKAILINHIQQLKPIIQQNSDVIFTLQNGFWGIWGENYYSDAFGCECNGPLSAQNWADRKEVTDSLLAILPENRLLSVRYPTLKTIMYNYGIPADSLTLAEAHDGSTKSRIGYHNDCFLVAANDYTFNNTTTEKPFWETESRYTIMGGESCGDTPTYTNCNNAMNDLENAHWTYLNDYYHPDVLDRWDDEGCFEEVSRRLGYRLQLVNGNYDTEAFAGYLFNYDFTIENVGFAAPVNARKVELVLDNGSQNYSFPLDVDPRNWYAGGSYNISGSLELPAGMSGGIFNLYLALPDEDVTLGTNPAYAIQLANNNLWDAVNGRNDLLTSVDITPSLLVAAKIHLEGAHQNSAPDLIRDDIRAQGLLPLEEPYSALVFSTVNNLAACIEDPTLLDITGPNAIVDWVFIEIRDAADPSIIRASKAALLRRDGAIVDTEGQSPVKIAVQAGNYYLAIKHRNHLGIMTAAPLSFSSSSSNLIDFTEAATAVYGINPRADLNGKMALWAGDADSEGGVNAADRSVVWNNRNTNSYQAADLDLSGDCDAADRSIAWNNRNKQEQLP